jgi:hypothetical protein
MPPPLARQRKRAFIQLRDEQGQLIDYNDTERTDRMRRHLEEINEAFSGIELRLPAHIGERRGDFLVINDSYVNLSQKTLWRIFNGDWKRGGRFYGPGFQSLPKELRSQLTINGEPVTEPDYPAHHLRILYALAGLSLHPEQDPYAVDGYDRNIVKRAMLILINARTPRQAMRAITHHLDLAPDDANRLLNELKQKHKSVESYFHSGEGCRLQRLDSDMTERILLGLFIRQGVSVLPIHDSFVVPQKYEDATVEQMEEAFETVILRARGSSRITKLDQKLKLKTTYTMVSSPSFLSSVLVPSFLPPVPACPSPGVFFDTDLRITPLGRIATLQALRRRDIRQAEFATLARIRRSTLSNILARRFGTSQQTADRITEVIATTPAFERQPFLPGLAA